MNLKLLFLYIIFFAQLEAKPQLIPLGTQSAEKTWVFLCGLTTDFCSKEQEEQRAGLDKIGKELAIKIIALEPPTRKEEYNNCLNWPHETKQETLETYNYILKQIPEQSIAGFIGFSNGGFFLNKLVQIKELTFPVISIGSAGYLFNNRLPNTLYLLIGKDDTHHHSGAKDYFTRSKNGNLNVIFKEFAGGHVMPFDELKQLIKDTQST